MVLLTGAIVKPTHGWGMILSQPFCFSSLPHTCLAPAVCEDVRRPPAWAPTFPSQSAPESARLLALLLAQLHSSHLQGASGARSCRASWRRRRTSWSSSRRCSSPSGSLRSELIGKDGFPMESPAEGDPNGGPHCSDQPLLPALGPALAPGPTRLQAPSLSSTGTGLPASPCGI